jgi:hypothetical protein
MRFIGYVFVEAVSQDKGVKVDEDLANSYALGRDICSTDLATVTDVVVNYRNIVINPNINGKKKHTPGSTGNNNNNNNNPKNYNEKDEDDAKHVSFAWKDKKH